MFIVVFSYIYLLYACRCWNRGGVGWNEPPNICGMGLALNI